MPIQPIDIGDDPLPNNAQPLPEGFSYEDYEVDAAAYRAQYGESPQQTANRALTAVLRPDFSTTYELVGEASGGNWTTEAADRQAQEGLTKQQAAIDYLAGRIPWSHVVGYLGLSRKVLGAITIADIRDLGA